MCGRYALFEQLDEIDHFLGILDRTGEITPNYNVVPTHTMPVVVNSAGRPEMEMMHWGFMGLKPKPGERPFLPVNTRAESISSKAMWKKSLLQRRCLVPMNGFYEWAGSKSNKTPFYIHGTNEPFLVAAGIYSELSPIDGSRSFSVITTSPNKVMENIHDRMPAFLHPSEFADWLKSDHSEEYLSDLLRPYPDDAIEAYRVSKDVGNVRNNHPGLVVKADLF